MSKILKSELFSIISRECPHGTSMGRYTMRHGGSPMVRIIQRIRQSSRVLIDPDMFTCGTKGKRSFRRCLRTSSSDHIKLSSLSQGITRKSNHREWIPHISTLWQNISLIQSKGHSTRIPQRSVFLVVRWDEESRKRTGWRP